MVDTCILFELLLSDFDIKHSSICPLEVEFSISFPHFVHDSLHGAQLQRCDVHCIASIATPACVWCFHKKIALLVRKTNYLVAFIGYNERNNWNYDF